MADKIDMSLDEIIKRDRIGVGKSRRGGKVGNRSGAALRGRKTNVRKISASTRQMKSVGVKKTKGFINKPIRKLPEKWLHDKFVGDIKSSSLMVSNLDYGVSDQDIRELFSEFGPLKKTTVHYDSTGRSLGKAEVIFVKTTDAIKAMKKYNGVPLDGRPMNIQPMVNTAVKANIASRIGNGEGFKKIGPKVQRGRQVRGQTRTRPTRGRGGKIGQRIANKPGQRKMPTAEELDADLDAYTNNI